MTSFVILPTMVQVAPKKVLLIEQQYPYGKSLVYMPMALVVVAAQLMTAGHQVVIGDLNTNELEGLDLQAFDVVGISVIGAPYIPQTIKLCSYIFAQCPNVKVMVGGQIISKLGRGQFERLFARTNAIQIASAEDLVPLFGEVLPPYDVSLVQVYEKMTGERLKLYLSNEFPLFVSQGCHYNCKKYCSADRNQPEKHHQLVSFTESLEHLVVKAVEFGLPELSCYASSLDFFQNPTTVAEYLKAIAGVREKYKFNFRIRALSCLLTFLKASRDLENFQGLLSSAGFWRVGFGVDGSGEGMWKKLNKVQNHTRDIKTCLNLCRQFGLKVEVIMVTGFPQGGLFELLKTVINCAVYLFLWPNVSIRAYMAKMVLPGNEGWETHSSTVEALLSNPQLFYNLEFNALGSPITHPRWLHRWCSNASYLLLTLGVAVFGRSISFPLLPQGQSGWYGKIAKFVNRRMPIVD